MSVLGPVLVIGLFAAGVVVPVLVTLGLRWHAGPLVILATLANLFFAVTLLREADRWDNPGLWLLFTLATLAFEIALVIGAITAVTVRRFLPTRLIALALAITSLPLLYLVIIAGSD